MIHPLLKRMFAKSIILSNAADGTYENGRRTFSASAAITSKYLFGKTTTTAGQISLSGSGNTSTGARSVGVITDEANIAGDPVAVHVLGLGGTQKALAGGSISIGDLITADANSQAVSFTAMSAGAGTFHIYGVALTPAVSGDRVEFMPTPGLEKTK